jgi:anti-sigma factor RsiW
MPDPTQKPAIVGRSSDVTESSLSAPTDVDEVTCQEFVELITDYVEGALSGPTLSQVEEHLVICDWCGTYLEQMDSTIALLGELAMRADGADGVDPPEALLAVLRERRRGLR